MFIIHGFIAIKNGPAHAAQYFGEISIWTAAADIKMFPHERIHNLFVILLCLSIQACILNLSPNRFPPITSHCFSDKFSTLSLQHNDASPCEMSVTWPISPEREGRWNGEAKNRAIFFVFATPSWEGKRLCNVSCRSCNNSGCQIKPI